MPDVAPISPADTTAPLVAPNEIDTTSSTSGTSQSVASPDTKGDVARQYAAGLAHAQAIKDEGAAKAAATNQQAGGLEMQAQLAELDRQEAERTRAAYAARIDAARKMRDEAEKAYEGHPFEDYFHRDGQSGTARHLLAAAAAFMGGKPAVENMQRTITMDFDRQKADMDRRRDIARARGEDVNQLYVQEAHENAALEVRRAKAHEALAAQVLAAQTRAGIPVDQAKSAQAYQKQLAEAEKAKLSADHWFDKTIQRSSTTRTVDKGQLADVGQQRLNLRKEQDLRAQMKQWATDNNVTGAKGLLVQHQNLDKLVKALSPVDENGRPRDVDPLTWANALTEMEKAVKGGAPNRYSIENAQKHLGGTIDQIRNSIQNSADGKPSPHVQMVIRRAMVNALKENEDEGRSHQKDFTNRFRKSKTLFPGAQDILDDGESGLLGEWGFAQRSGEARPAVCSTGASILAGWPLEPLSNRISSPSG